MLNEIMKLIEYREMLKNLVKKELRSRYKGSVLGFFWTFLNPLLMLIIYSIVFSVVMKVTIPNYSYPIFLFVGLVPWMFFSTTFQQSTTVILTNSNLIKKIQFPKIILPLSVTITNLVNMIFTFVIVFAALFFYKAPISIFYIYLPLVIIIESVLVLGFSFILSSLTVYFRDLEHIVSIIIMAWFYVTPIVYPIDYIPEKYLSFFYLNPMTQIVQAYRDILMFNKAPDLISLLYVFIASTILLIIGYSIFYKLQKRFAEEI